MKNRTSAQKKGHSPSLSVRLLLVFLALLTVGGTAYGIFAAVAGPQGYFLRRTAVMQTTHYTVDGAMMSYYYYDFYHAQLETLGEELENEGLDPTKPLREQTRPTGESWYDYFMTDTLDYVRRILVFAEAARALGDSEEDAREIADATFAAVADAATGEGVALADYIAAYYGEGVREEDVRRAIDLSAYASLRFEKLAATVYTEAELEAAYREDPAAYFAVDYIIYPIKAKVSSTASESEMREAFLAAETAANTLASAATEREFTEALADLLRKEDAGRKNYEINHLISDAYIYAARPTDRDELSLWLADARREAGDTHIFGENGDYRVVFFLRAEERISYHRVSMRHILLAYNDYPMVSETRTAAERMLADFLAAEPTEEKFADLAAAFSADAATVGTGGLYTDIGRDTLEKELADWLLADGREAGDTAVLQSAYGFHIVYFVGENELAVWQEEATAALQEKTYAAYLAAANLRIYNSATDCLPDVVAVAKK